MVKIIDKLARVIDTFKYGKIEPNPKLKNMQTASNAVKKAAKRGKKPR